jgi:hypothetical protein
LNPIPPAVIDVISDGEPGIYIGAKPLLPGTTACFSELLQQMLPGNAAIIFVGGYHQNSNGIGHYMSVWEDYTDCRHGCSETKYFFYNSISAKKSEITLYGPMEPKELDKFFKRNSGILNAYHRSIFVFNLPVDKATRENKIDQAIDYMNHRLHHVLRSYFHLEEFGVSLPVQMFSNKKSISSSSSSLSSSHSGSSDDTTMNEEDEEGVLIVENRYKLRRNK